MSLLKFFQNLNFESKTTPYEFYNVLSRLTDNTGTQSVKVGFSFNQRGRP